MITNKFGMDVTLLCPESIPAGPYLKTAAIGFHKESGEFFQEDTILKKPMMKRMSSI
jgi:hypothetical protein